MPTSKGFLQRFAAPATVVMLVLLPTQPVVAAVAVGQTASSDATVDGVRVPPGTTLLSPALVEAGDLGAVLHLANGEVLALAPRSTAVVASVDGGIRVAVEEGNLAYTSNQGELETLSRTETILVAQQGEIQQGERIAPVVPPGDEEQEDLCELQEWTATLWQTCRFDDPDDDDCDWELIEVPMSEVTQYLERTAVLACKDRNDLDLDCDCKQRIGAFAWWMPVAGVAGGVALYQILQDDDDQPASPSTP